MTSQFQSPNEMLAKSKEVMLDGRDPVTRDDWALIMNCLAANIMPDACESACEVMRILYDMPLTKEDVQQIVEFQIAHREE
jgi:hypothetical protein